MKETKSRNTKYKVYEDIAYVKLLIKINKIIYLY